jgi:hypothetical protein
VKTVATPATFTHVGDGVPAMSEQRHTFAP